MKAATQCAAEIDKKSADAAAVYRFLGYASGSGIRLSPEGANSPPKEKWWWDPTKQKHSRSDYTPEDRQRARAMAEARVHNAVDSMDMALISSPLAVG
ncbi:hypothetical protein QFC21_002224 [Naganishia friedmannii]|uniref:Uncharacterized protein n=1 Tax=Naganishia friedmannii TaxID=89922 RepID=A0ACC2VWR7_9TREE|nr:hypothetical protein QFC21_002224 [Naganishia friedmannii]